MTGRIATWLFAAALGVVSIGCQPADEPVTDTTVDVDLGEPVEPADSNTTTTVIESPEVTETPEVTESPEPESTGLELPPADEPVLEEEPAAETVETEE